MAIKIDWDKYYLVAPAVIPHEAIGDEETGLIRTATTRNAFDKFLESTREKVISREKLEKYCEYQKVVFMEDEDFYKLNPSYWHEFDLVIEE
jgi:hypothetical protein